MAEIDFAGLTIQANFVFKGSRSVIKSMKFGVTYTIIFCLLQVCVLNSVAQLKIQNYGIVQGLAQTQVSCLAEDSLGYLWAGTLGGGLSRFDGLEFKNYTMSEGLPNNVITDLLVKNNEVYIATNNGISKYNGNQFINYPVGKTDGLFPQIIFNREDTIFYKLNNGKLGIILGDSVYSSIDHPIFNNVKEVTKLNGTTLVHRGMGIDSELIIIHRKELLRLNVSDLFTQLFSAFRYRGNILLSTNGGLFQLERTSIRKILAADFAIYGFDLVNESFIGVNDFDLVQVRIGQEYTKGEKLNYVISSSLADHEGNLWWGTDRGLFKVFPSLFEKQFNDIEKNDPVTAVNSHEGRLWIGTSYQGIKIYKNNQLIQKYNFGTQNRNFVSLMLHDKRGRLFIGTPGGLAIYEHGKFNWMPSSLIESAVCGDFDENNNAYFGSSKKGLYHLTSDGKISHITEFSDALVWSVKYNTWDDYFVIGSNIGLWTIKDGKVEKVNRPELDGIELLSMDWLDPNILITGTFGRGVVLHNFKSNSILKIDKTNGLVSNTLFFVFSDNNGFWVGSERGIDFVQMTEDKKKVNSITHYDDKDGLLGLEANQGAHYRSGDTLAFGLVDGLYRFKNKAKNEISNPLHIDEIELFTKGNPTGSANGINSSNYTLKRYSFSHLENHLTFSFNKVNKRNPSDYFYRYLLKGADQNWSAPSPIKSVTYANLSPGTYSLQIVATDKSGTFEFDKTTFSFTIEPAFYQTVFFKVIIGFLIVSLSFLIAYRYNKRKVKRALHLQEIKHNEQTKLRKEIARDFHDDLGNQMARMINYVGILRIKDKLELDTYEALHGYSQRILTGTKDFVWALDPTNDELSNLVIHLKDFGERMFHERNIDFRFHGEIPHDFKLPLGYNRQTNLIFKEAMTNAFKHSQATVVNFNLEVQNDKIILELQDNGIGISPDNWEKSENGISNMKIRAHRLKANLTLISNGSGTKIKLELKV